MQEERRRFLARHMCLNRLRPGTVRLQIPRRRSRFSKIESTITLFEAIVNKKNVTTIGATTLYNQDQGVLARSPEQSQGTRPEKGHRGGQPKNFGAF